MYGEMPNDTVRLQQRFNALIFHLFFSNVFFWSCLLLGMVRAIGCSRGLPIGICISICFVSRLYTEMVHTIGSCCDLRTEIVLLFNNLFLVSRINSNGSANKFLA